MHDGNSVPTFRDNLSVTSSKVKQYKKNFILSHALNVGWDSVVGITTRYGLDRPGSNPSEGEIFRTHPERRWGPPNFQLTWYRVFPGGKAAGAWC